MSKDRLHIRRLMALVLLSIAAVLMGLALMLNRAHRDPASTAGELSRAVGKRVVLMEQYMDQAASQPKEAWLELDLPDDMVLYRYVDDTLQCWQNQFPLLGDDLRLRTLVQRLGDGRSALTSPLTQVGESLSFVNYGPKWYLVEARIVDGGVRLIAGLEMVDELRAGSLNGVNKRFSLAEGYTLQPLSSGVGVPVSVGGTPLMKLVSEQVADSGRYHPLPFWLSVLLSLSALLLLLAAWPGWGRFALTVLCQGGILTGIYFYGQHLSRSSQLFSPLLYADGAFLYSLGAVVVINLGILCFVSSLMLMKGTFLSGLYRRSGKGVKLLSLLLVLLLSAGICIYFHIAFKSILQNSEICLELYKISLLSSYTALVYLSFLGLALTLPMLLSIASPIVRSLTGVRSDAFSGRSRAVFAILFGTYCVIASSVMGYQRERKRVEVWAARLAMSRDLSLELQLRAVEGQISSDLVIRALSQLGDGSHLIRSRLSSTYMGRISQDYDISVLLPGDERSADILNDNIRSGVRLGDGSHFFYSLSPGGQARYTGFFTYLDPAAGPSSVLVLVESKHNREDRGYLSLMGVTEPGRASVPPRYSFAKYTDGRLVSTKGEYAYPTLFDGSLPQRDGFAHFLTQVSDSEMVVLSRPETPLLFFMVEGVLLSLLAFLFISLLTRRRRRDSSPRYFQNRIRLVLYFSLTFTLIGMAAFSVWFVYRRNAADMQGIMNARINIIQSMAQERLRDYGRSQGMPEAMEAVERIGNTLHTDLSIFSPSGVLICSTTPEVYERMFLGHRVDDRAYKLLVHDHQRFAILREKVGRRRFYNLHAPVFNSSGEIAAIVSSPYTGRSVALETDTILHIATIFTAFILLLLLSRYVTMAIISRMFRPISEISRKMKVTDVDHLEELEYDRDDELLPLVESYNRMVRDLSESTQRLAQVERDKAWTDMARRVAHDIKNPLTPIKLKLQMLMRMKLSGNPLWVEKFDEVSATVLEHVDMLADSADQFSTFAKLYDQPSEPFDLDEMIRQEVALYDTREDVSLEYIGFAGAMVSGPKPQLIRVIMNLLTNAMQAVEELDGPRRIAVSLRNGVVDGFYDLVVEDNGAGVSEEIRERIFTPDFTTKSKGSGLGLAICKKIVEHCGGEIFYARSFTLGGAAFTVRYPKL